MFVYLPRRAHFEAHFSKKIAFFATNGRYGKVVLVDIFLKDAPC